LVVPWRFHLFPLNTICLTRLGKSKSYDTEELITLTKKAEDDFWNLHKQNGLWTELASEPYQKIGKWAQSIMDIPQEQQSQVYKGGDANAAAFTAAITKFYKDKKHRVLTINRSFRIFLGEESAKNIPIGITVYGLLHEAAHATQTPYLSYMRARFPISKLSNIFFVITLGYALGKLPYPYKLTTRVSFLANYLACKKLCKKLQEDYILERLAERKVLKKITCTQCLRECSKVTHGTPYNTPQKLLKKAAQLEKTGKTQLCPFHQEKEG